MGFVITDHVKAKMKDQHTSTAATRPSSPPSGGPPPWHSVMRMPWKDQLCEDCDFFAAVCQSTEFESLAKTPHIHTSKGPAGPIGVEGLLCGFPR